MDGRPLSSGRGIGHEIVKVFKSYIRVAASKNESSKSVTDPFLCLQLRCPRGTYDVNIEPAKDDLLFEDRELVLTLVESLFSGYYGELERPSKSDTRGTKEKISNSTEGSTGFELLLAQKSTAKPVTDPHDSGSPLNETLPHISLSQRPLRGDPVCSTADHSNNGLSESLNPSPAARTKRSSFVNPWSISKINASFQTPQRNNNTSAFTSPVNLPSGSLQHSVQRGSEPGSLQDSPNLSDLTSPPTSRLASGSPVRRRRQHPQTSNESSPEGTRIPTARRADRDRDRDHYGNGALDTWFQKTTQASLQEPPVEEAYPQGPNNSSLSVLAHRRFGAPVNSSPSQAHVDGQNDGCSENSPQTNFSPEASPRDPALCEDQARYLPESMDSGRGFPVLDRWAAQLHKDIACEEPSDLEKALDFERRKKEAIKKSRIRFTDCENPSNSQSTTVSHSPHHSRYLAAKAALTSSQTSIAEPVSMTKLSPHDPRAYLLRQNRDSSAGENLTVGEKVRKTPTHRLPFERIPGDSNLHNLGITCSVDLSPDSDILRRSIPGDVAITNDNAPTAFSASTIGTCLPLWNERLMLIMKEQYKSTKEQDLPDMDIDLSPIMIRHLKDLDASGQ